MDYKKYSLEQLENWIHDAMSCDNVSADEIYDTIYKVVTENYYHHKHHVRLAYELMERLNGHRKVESFGDNKDKVKRWILPVEVDGLTGECYVQFPDDLMEAANLKEGEQIEWVDNKDGTFTLKHRTMSDTLKSNDGNLPVWV